jgi:hypothetical protein
MGHRCERNICNSVQVYGTCVLVLKIQQNSCALTSSNLEILIMQHLRRLVPRLPFTFAFYQIKASSVKQADLGAMFKKASKCVCTTAVVLSHDPLSHTLSTSAVKSAANVEAEL